MAGHLLLTTPLPDGSPRASGAVDSGRSLGSPRAPGCTGRLLLSGSKVAAFYRVARRESTLLSPQCQERALGVPVVGDKPRWAWRAGSRLCKGVGTRREWEHLAHNPWEHPPARRLGAAWMWRWTGVGQASIGPSDLWKVARTTLTPLGDCGSFPRE